MFIHIQTEVSQTEGAAPIAVKRQKEKYYG